VAWRCSGLVENKNGTTSFITPINFDPFHPREELPGAVLDFHVDRELNLVVPVFTGIKGHPKNKFHAVADYDYIEVDANPKGNK